MPVFQQRKIHKNFGNAQAIWQFISDAVLQIPRTVEVYRDPDGSDYMIVRVWSDAPYDRQTAGDSIGELPPMQ